MPTLDDERFEAYLKQFRPLIPESLPAKTSGYRARRNTVLWAYVLSVTAMLVGALAVRRPTHRTHVIETIRDSESPDRLMGAQPLTMRSTNALMTKAPSFKALVDDLATPSQTIALPKGKRSAVAVLSKEKVKP